MSCAGKYSSIVFALVFSLCTQGQPADFSFHSAEKSPKKAALFSIIPGLGQAYNRKYWKIPVIYAAGYSLYYFIAVPTNEKYHLYKEALVLRTDNDTNTVDDFVNIYSGDNLITLKNYYRRNRDLTYIGITAIYLLNIIDAAVDAHLFDFNVNKDLSFSLQPEMFFSGRGILVPMIWLSVKL